MTRMRGNKSDYQTFSRRRQKLEHIAMKALAKGIDSLTDRECELHESKDHERAVRSVQRESREARRLAIVAQGKWWEPGLWRIEHRTTSWREAEQRSLEGAKSGMPDYMLHVPFRIGSLAFRAAIELKAPPAPVTAEDQWWMGDWPAGQKSWHGLRRDQWRALRLLGYVGYRTFVAYGADDAIQWIDRLCGPKPERLPEWWDE